MEYRQRLAILQKYEDKLISLYPHMKNARYSGIYIMTRVDENGFKFAYIGQSKNILRRLAEHLINREMHIDKSLKKHGLYSADNPFGWDLRLFYYYNESVLNDKEREFEVKYANAGYQLRNKTIGGQNAGKVGLNENKSPKGYRDGLKQGYKNAQKKIAQLMKYLDVNIKGQTNKIKERMLEKFKNFFENI